MSSNAMILYVKTGCPWCTYAEDYLSKHGYAYQRIDVRKDRSAFTEMQRISKQTLTPTLSIGELVLPDFGPSELETFLSKHQILPAK
ncbi:MAG: glutaredoxin family protein [Verrucomicrobia bacterium]|nr:glutaredoxin family protein [Verrucomicrobiota bacterium]